MENCLLIALVIVLIVLLVYKSPSLPPMSTAASTTAPTTATESFSLRRKEHLAKPASPSFSATLLRRMGMSNAGK